MGTTLGKLKEVPGRALLLRAELNSRRSDAYRTQLAPQVGAIMWVLRFRPTVSSKLIAALLGVLREFLPPWRACL